MTKPAVRKNDNTNERFGWMLLAVGVTFGTVIETMHGFKTASFLLDPLRREMWTIAHFHAGFLGLVNLAFARRVDAFVLSDVGKRRASIALRVGSVLLPLGFFLGGFAHAEGDPGIGILLAPVGALLVVAAVIVVAVASVRR